MRFDYDTYRSLIRNLKEKRYEITDYLGYTDYDRTVILRHDIDFDISCSVRMAQIEAEEGAYSTFFVLLTSDFYNPFSMKSKDMLGDILKCGCHIGLHFDEMRYPEAIGKPKKVVELILFEKKMLSDLLSVDINTVSMHQPSREIIEADLDIPGMVNSYSSKFFKQSKYLSDSCRAWREPVEDIIASGEYDRLHILTHAFWWGEKDSDLHDSLYRLVNSANRQRYNTLMEQVSDYRRFLHEDEVR